jgi:signal transduction histidine kinase
MRTKLLVAAHLALLALAVAGYCLVHQNPNFGSGLSGLYTSDFSDTPACAAMIDADAHSIFRHVFLKNIFESDGELDLAMEVLSVQTGPGQEAEYTIDQMVRYAKNRGYYLTEAFAVTGGDPEAHKNDATFHVNWRSYNPTPQYSGPGDAFETLEQLSVEVLALLGEYYASEAKLINRPSNLYFAVTYESPGEDPIHYGNTGSKTLSELKSLGAYVYTTGKSLDVESDMSAPPRQVMSLLESNNPFQNSESSFILALDTTYPAEDAYRIANASFQEDHQDYVTGYFMLVAGVLGMALSLVGVFAAMWLGCAPKRSDGAVDGAASAFRSTAFCVEDALILCGVILWFGFTYLLRSANYFMHIFVPIPDWPFAQQLYLFLWLYICLLFLVVFLAGKAFSRSVLSHSRICRLFADIRGYLDGSPFAVQATLLFFAYILVSGIIAGAMWYAYPHREMRLFSILFFSGAPLLVFWNVFALYTLLRQAASRQRLSDAIRQISAGNTDVQIDLAGVSQSDKALAIQVNRIGDVLEEAIREKVKSERLKADLITNVSHDIKTPLTSIINYVDLLKREHIRDEKVSGYLEILDQKSQRLKTLTEDLVEASKASSGNIQLQLSRIDYTEMVLQTIGEFGETFAKRSLTLVANVSPDPLYIEADGRRLWRVLENLFNNAFKYSMAGSRVYVDLFVRGAPDAHPMAVFSIKNVSEYPLNISPDELTERFVRGDISRTTEGSGLGLSIAKSLTDLQRGDFQLFIDGDLFKAEVAFPLLGAQAKSNLEDTPNAAKIAPAAGPPSQAKSNHEGSATDEPDTGQGTGDSVSKSKDEPAYGDTAD